MPEWRDELRPGDVVMLPDGALAAVERIVGTDAHVVEWTKHIGRGPWIFPVAELALAETLPLKSRMSLDR